jgi:hypothetical protein
MTVTSRSEQERHDARTKAQLRQAEAAFVALIALKSRRAVRGAFRAGRSPVEALAVAFRDSILHGRQNARGIALGRLQDQLGLRLVGDTRAALVDATRAIQVARKQAREIAIVAEATEGKSAIARWGSALNAQLWRAETVAATETFSAATAEREAAAAAGAATYSLEFLRVWDAQLDACKVCQGLDGTIVGIHEDFPGGLRPGSAHPRCRCFETILRGTGRGREVTFKPVVPKAVARVAAPKRARPEPKPGYVAELRDTRKALAYERMLASKATPHALKDARAAGTFRSLLAGKIPKADFGFLREGMRSMTALEQAYSGRALANDIATGRAIPPGASRPLPPISISIYPGEVNLRDGRHRTLAAKQFGATEIRAQITQYDRRGDQIWSGVRVIPLPR